MAIIDDINQLRHKFELLSKRFDLGTKRTRQHELDAQLKDPVLWRNPQKGQQIAQEAGRLNSSLQAWLSTEHQLNELRELAALDDETLEKELHAQYEQVNTQLKTLESSLQMSGPHDDANAILSIRAGAGGTDAQDWAQMLRRMYIRWAEKNNYKVVLLEESMGDEAGIKSTTLEINGQQTYGKLKGEHGVHRLVRLSPFNADNLRQTSFAMVEILPVVDKPEVVEIDEKDLKIDVYRSGGHGGQSVNTTDSAVRVTHIPTGLSVAIQNERSQLQNKETALTVLRSRLLQLQLEQHQENIRELKGPNKSAEWGNQIRSYVLHPYKQVKDLRTKYETSDVESVLDGGLEPLIEAAIRSRPMAD